MRRVRRQLVGKDIDSGRHRHETQLDALRRQPVSQRLERRKVGVELLLAVAVKAVDQIAVPAVKDLVDILLARKTLGQRLDGDPPVARGKLIGQIFFDIRAEGARKHLRRRQLGELRQRALLAFGVVSVGRQQTGGQAGHQHQTEKQADEFVSHKSAPLKPEVEERVV